MEVWLAASGAEAEQVWVGGTADGESGGGALLRNALPAGGVADMSDLEHLHEPAVLQNLQLRCEAGRVYTWCGDVLVSINPYTRDCTWEGVNQEDANQSLPLYSSWVMERYSGHALGALPPHVFAVADQAYRGLLLRQTSQSVVVSGESGAGKTEATKAMLRYIAWASRNTDAITGEPIGVSTSTPSSGSVADVVLAANPLLEAVGNAKTLRNDNSSRFGKYLELLVADDGSGRIKGALMKTYMLERPRVTTISAGERNYHIFYQLLAGLPAEKAAAVGLQCEPTSFRVLNASGCIEIEDVNDAAEYAATMEALHAVGATPADVDTLVHALAAVLHMGNIEFESIDDASKVKEAEGCPGLSEAASCMQVTSEDLTAALTTTHTKFVGEEVVKPNTMDQAVAIRDATARLIYARLFDWIVGKISESFGGNPDETHDSDHHTHSHGREAYVGVLDLFGFEFFQHNSFEQLCINYANEKLQQLFIHHVLASVQAEYKDEGIPAESVDFVDNGSVISLISRRDGILSALDEELRLPNGSDASFGSKLSSMHARDPAFETSRFGSDTFTICHFAGKVTYEVAGFLKKNTDTTPDGLTRVLASSKDPFFQALSVPAVDTDVASPAAHEKHDTKGRARMTTLGVQSKKVGTVGAKFSRQLGNLMLLLESTELHFVRCVKPNAQKRPRVMERHMACDQLRSAGLLSAVQISRVGFPSRMAHTQLLANCAVLLKTLPAVGAGTDESDADAANRDALRQYNAEDASSAARACEALLSLTVDSSDAAEETLDQARYAIGKTKVFLRAGLLSELSALCNVQLGVLAVTIQRYARGWLCRLAIKKMELAEQERKDAAAVVIQASMRGKLARIAWAKKRAAEAARIAAEEKAKAEAEQQKRAQEKAEEEAAMKAAAGDSKAEKSTLQGQLETEKELRMKAEAELATARGALSTTQKSLELKTAALQAAERAAAELRKQLAEAKAAGTRSVAAAEDNATHDPTEPRPMTPKSAASPIDNAAANAAQRRAALEARLHKVLNKHAESTGGSTSEPSGPPPHRPGWKACWSISHNAWYWWDETTLETTWVDPAAAAAPATATRTSALLNTPSKAKQTGKQRPTHRPRPRR